MAETIRLPAAILSAARKASEIETRGRVIGSVIAAVIASRLATSSVDSRIETNPTLD